MFCLSWWHEHICVAFPILYNLHVNTATAVNAAFIGNFFEFSFTCASCQVESSNCWLKFSPDGEWWSWMNKHLMVIAYCIFCKPCLRMQCFHMWLCIQAWQGLHQGLHIKPCTWSLLSLAELCRSPGICLVQIQLVIPRVTSVLSTFRSWCIPVSRLSNGMGGSKEGAHLQIWPWSALHT